MVQVMSQNVLFMEFFHDMSCILSVFLYEDMSLTSLIYMWMFSFPNSQETVFSPLHVLASFAED